MPQSSNYCINYRHAAILASFRNSRNSREMRKILSRAFLTSITWLLVFNTATRHLAVVKCDKSIFNKFCYTIANTQFTCVASLQLNSALQKDYICLRQEDYFGDLVRWTVTDPQNNVVLRVVVLD